MISSICIARIEASERILENDLQIGSQVLPLGAASARRCRGRQRRGAPRRAARDQNGTRQSRLGRARLADDAERLARVHREINSRNHAQPCPAPPRAVAHAVAHFQSCTRRSGSAHGSGPSALSASLRRTGCRHGRASGRIVPTGPHSHDAPLAHDGHPVGKPATTPRSCVMSTSDRRCALLSSARSARICAWIVTSSAGRRLIGDDERRIAGKCGRDHDPLAHAARQLVRVLAVRDARARAAALARVFPVRARAPRARRDLSV